MDVYMAMRYVYVKKAQNTHDVVLQCAKQIQRAQHSIQHNDVLDTFSMR